MAKTPSIRKPTRAEQEILQVLWKLGPSTVRSIHDRLSVTRGIGYTTVLKTMQLMVEKGILTRQTDRRPHIYETANSREDTERFLVRDLLEGPYQGATARLVMHALSLKPESAETLEEIERLIHQAQSQTPRREETP